MPATERRRTIVRVRLVGAVTVLLLGAGAVPAGAEPIADPQPGSPCPVSVADAFTVLPDAREVVACGIAGGGLAWQPVTQPFDPSDVWLSYGPGLTLNGQGRRNPEILSGQWTATPLDGGSCGAEQAPVTDAGVGAPQTTTGKPGEMLSFEVLPVVYTITLTGNCLWERSA